MNTLYAMIPLALLLLVAAFWAFFWAVRSGQFDDLDTPGTLVLFDEERPAGAPSRDERGGARSREERGAPPPSGGVDRPDKTAIRAGRDAP